MVENYGHKIGQLIRRTQCMLALETPFVIQIISARVRFNFFFRRHTTLLRPLRDYTKNGRIARGLLRGRQTFS